MKNTTSSKEVDFVSKASDGIISSKLSMALFLIMIYALAFDFRSELEVGKVFVVLIGVISLLSGLVLVVVLNSLDKRSLTLVVPALFLLVGSSLSGIAREQLIYDVVSLSMPLLFFIIALISVTSIRVEPDRLKMFIHIIIAFALLSVVFKCVFGFLYYGLTLDNVRYQIISPAVIIVFSYGVASLLYKKQRFGIIALILSIIVIIISVTRSYIVVFLAVVLFWVLCMPLSFWRKHIYIGLKLFLFILLLVVFTYSFFPDVFERWSVRLFSGVEAHGVAVTAITRIAEIDYQIDRLLESPVNLMAGMGVAAETRFSPEYRQILSIVYSDDFEYVGKGFGHNTYVGIIFTGGLIIGSVFICSILFNIKSTIMLFRTEVLKKQRVTDYQFCLAWGGGAAFGYSVYGLLGGTFGDRLFALSYGLSFGLVFFSKRFILKYA